MNYSSGFFFLQIFQRLRVFEHRSSPLLSAHAFVRRMLRFFLMASLLILVSLLIGIAGYRLTENMSWIDSLLNASMILSGMGPASNLSTDNGKVFASLYALFSGIVFISTAGIVIAPVVHRISHTLHVETDDDVAS